jgi:CheY-like chemotaxis protein
MRIDDAFGGSKPKQVQDFCIWRIVQQKPLYTVFMIDDNPSTAILYNLMANRMSAEFIAVGYARGIRESYEILRRLQADIIVVDHMMPEIDGFEGIAKLKPLLPNSAFLLLSYQYGFGDDSQLIERAKAVGADMLRNYGVYLPPAYIKILRETLESFQQGLQDY